MWRWGERCGQTISAMTTTSLNDSAWQWRCKEATKSCTADYKCSASRAAVPWEVAEESGLGDSSGLDADPVHLIEVVLSLISTNGQAKVMSGRCGAAEILARATCLGIVILKHSICYMYKSCPTTIMDSGRHQNTPTTKLVDLLARSLERNVPVDVHSMSNSTWLIWEQTILHLASVHLTLWWYYWRAKWRGVPQLFTTVWSNIQGFVSLCLMLLCSDFDDDAPICICLEQ